MGCYSCFGCFDYWDDYCYYFCPYSFLCEDEYYEDEWDYYDDYWYQICQQNTSFKEKKLETI